MNYKRIYCVYCGEKNNAKDLKCKKCKKKLNPKENMFLDYLKAHIKDDLKGKVQDKAISIIKNYIISHLYGFVLTATLIFTITSVVVTTIGDKQNITNVSSKPSVLVSNLNKCIFDNYSEPINLCDDGYELKDSICVRKNESDAIKKYVCSAGYFLSNGKCISNENFDMLSKQECIAPKGEFVVGAHVDNGVCFAEYCSGWTDGVCSAGASEPIDFTVVNYCPSGTAKINGACKKTKSYEIVYSCEVGEIKGNRCIVKEEKETKLGCEDNYIYNEECNVCVLGEE